MGGVGHGGTGDPPSAFSMGVDWFESCDMGGVGHGGTGSVPSAFSVGVDWVERCDMRGIEYPASVNASRVRQESFLENMLPPLCNLGRSPVQAMGAQNLRDWWACLVYRAGIRP